ncbi:MULTISPECIES: helix-turn-helix domain-containing protein [unclassified Shewanella]|uniref:helix-turn-helix domain-containing protein n=1 Tax=unclassified Shewanella TaxID=196818 RepID=UPI002DD677A9|nr:MULTISPECIES: helix-turn-helix domain-containing protein [unclassified Shewanella]
MDYFLKLHTSQYNIDLLTLSASTMKQLLDYSWPGNVRERANRIEGFVLLGDEYEMVEELRDCPTPINTNEFSLPESGIQWETFEKSCLEQSMSKHQGNRTKAAKFLGLSYKAFLYRLEKYQLV